MTYDGLSARFIHCWFTLTIIAFVAQTWPEMRVGEMPPLVRLCYSIKSCSIYYGALNYERKHADRTNIVCLFRLSNTRHRKRTQWYPLTCTLWKYFPSFLFSPPSSFLSPHSLRGNSHPIPLELVTQTNQYAVIVCPHLCMLSRQGSYGGAVQWQSSVLAVGRWCFSSEMAQWFPVYQNAYGHYNGHCFTLTWHELLF